jgi:hypothetical protein
MDSRSRFAFAALLAAQAAHSVEEYMFRLFDVFGPARFVSGLFGTDLATGFALANVVIVLFGLWCYVARVRPAHSGAVAYAWFWTCLEFANGVGHLLIAGVRGRYFPGAGTAVLLIGVSSYLGARLARQGRRA